MSITLALPLIFTVCLLLGVPVAISIGVAVLGVLMMNDFPISFIVQNAFVSTDSFALLAVPLFILAGSLMETGGISRRIVHVANSLVGNVTGGLAIVTVMGCAFFAAISGSGPATVAAIGTIMIPAMARRQYGKDFASAVASSGGSLGILIPPSIPMIIYGIVGNVSIGDMFLAGIIPGIISAFFLGLVAYWISKKRGYTGTGEPFSFKVFGKALWDAKWALLTPIIILGGIYSGIFTPTESAVIAVVYGMIIGAFVYKELKLKDLYKSFVETAITTGAVLIILGVSFAFGKYITMNQIPQNVAKWMLSLTENIFLIMLIFTIFIIITGMFMETLAQILIFTPLFLPVMVQLGVDPLVFGILLVIGCEIGFLTPPLGVNLFVATGISGVKIEEVSKAVIPFVIALITVMILIIFMPSIVTFLPNLLD